MDPLPLRESPAIFLLHWGYFRGQVIYVRSDNAAHGHLGAVSQKHHPDPPTPRPEQGLPVPAGCRVFPVGLGGQTSMGWGHLGRIAPPCHLLGPLHTSVRSPAVLPSPSRGLEVVVGRPGGEGGHAALHPLPPQNPLPWSPRGKTWVFQGCHSNVMHLSGCHGNPGRSF